MGTNGFGLGKGKRPLCLQAYRALDYDHDIYDHDKKISIDSPPKLLSTLTIRAPDSFENPDDLKLIDR